MQTSSWCLGLKHLGLRTDCAPSRDCQLQCKAVTKMYKLSCRGTLFITQMPMLTWDLGWVLVRVWRDIADMNLWKVTTNWWLIVLGLPVPSKISKLIHLLVYGIGYPPQAASGASMRPPHYLYLDLPEYVMRNVSRFLLFAHTLTMESSIWRDGHAHCDKCSCAAMRNGLHVLFHCQELFVCYLGKSCQPLIICTRCHNHGNPAETYAELTSSMSIRGRYTSLRLNIAKTVMPDHCYWRSVAWLLRFRRAGEGKPHAQHRFSITCPPMLRAQ